MAYNDDANGSTTDSRMVANLVAGRTYTFAISNYLHTQNGLYYLKFSPPTISTSATTDLGRIMASGIATLSGTTLTLDLYGQTMTSFDRSIDFIKVQLFDVHGKQIGTGSWYYSFGTAGQFIPGDPQRNDVSHSFDLSGWDLSGASYLSIQVGYNTY